MDSPRSRKIAVARVLAALCTLSPGLVTPCPSWSQTAIGPAAIQPFTPVNQPGQTAANPTSPLVGPLSSVIPSPGIPAVYAHQSIQAASTDRPPEIDGSLNDPCWRRATHIVGFYPWAGTTDFTGANQTEAWICADKTHLYIAFHCLCANPAKIVASASQRNADVTRDDFVGLDIDSQNSRRNYSTFLVNARGTQEQVLEGGTATNITWAGDWTAAARRTPDGYTVEIAIPFGLMRYPRGTKSFGILLYRHLAGQLVLEAWPYTPLPDATNDLEAQYMGDFTGINPPFFSPKPTFLPYVLSTAGDGTAGRVGVDIKYPLSTTLSGVASLYPDFATIEQAITTINFSYTQKLLTDARPFFAEGASFLPDNDLFYSRAIGEVDEGLKVVGKDGNTTIGVLGTNTSGPASQTEAALNLRQDFNAYSDAGAEFVSDNQYGLPSNRVARVFGGYGWRGGKDQFTLSGFHTASFVSGDQAGGSDQLAFQNDQGIVNAPYYNVKYLDIGPNFVSDLGYVPEIDKRGSSVTVGLTNILAKGPIQATNVELDADQYQHHSGGFFHDDASLSGFLALRSGWTFVLVPTVDQYNENHDHYVFAQARWGQNTLFQQGSAADSFGRLDSQPYNFLTIQEGFLLSRPFNIQLSYNRLVLGGATTTSTIVTPAYLLSATRTLGARIVEQAGAVDVHFSFSQQVRTGADIFVLFGDPNSAQTRGMITLKVVQPFT